MRAGCSAAAVQGWRWMPYPSCKWIQRIHVLSRVLVFATPPHHPPLFSRPRAPRSAAACARPPPPPPPAASSAPHHVRHCGRPEPLRGGGGTAGGVGLNTGYATTLGNTRAIWNWRPTDGPLTRMQASRYPTPAPGPSASAVILPCPNSTPSLPHPPTLFHTSHDWTRPRAQPRATHQRPRSHPPLAPRRTSAAAVSSPMPLQARNAVSKPGASALGTRGWHAPGRRTRQAHAVPPQPRLHTHT